MHSDRAPFFLKLAAWGGVVFLHFPILIIAAYAFNTEDAAFSFPPQGLTLRWFSVAAQRSDILDSVTLSLKVAALATLIALVLGTLAAAALWRRDFIACCRGDVTAANKTNPVSLLLLMDSCQKHRRALWGNKRSVTDVGFWPRVRMARRFLTSGFGKCALCRTSASIYSSGSGKTSIK